jgi:hypothetical protein
LNKLYLLFGFLAHAFECFVIPRLVYDFPQCIHFAVLALGGIMVAGGIMVSGGISALSFSKSVFSSSELLFS